MQPTLCSRCKKNVAVVFISRTNEKNETVNEGLCLKCAAQLGLPQVEDMMKRMGISPDDLEGLNNEMMQAFGGAEELGDVLFAAVKAARFAGVDPEDALNAACEKFIRRYAAVEQGAADRGVPVSDLTLAEMTDLWNGAKQRHDSDGF